MTPQEDFEHESVITTLDRQSAQIENLDARIEAAEIIMTDAAKHLQRRQMGACNNTLAARMFDWIDGMEEEP